VRNPLRREQANACRENCDIQDEEVLGTTPVQVDLEAILVQDPSVVFPEAIVV
jgi:hypothetical protein